MTDTEELRRLLNERGVEWESGLPTETIVREPNDALYVERPDGRMHVYFRSYLAPEQAIAATLGPCNDSCNCTNGERTDLAAENAKLRAMRDTWAENDARLRELVRTIYMCSSIRCNQCEYGYGDTCAFDAEAELRELGIEVDE